MQSIISHFSTISPATCRRGLSISDPNHHILVFGSHSFLISSHVRTGSTDHALRSPKSSRAGYIKGRSKAPKGFVQQQSCLTPLKIRLYLDSLDLRCKRLLDHFFRLGPQKVLRGPRAKKIAGGRSQAILAGLQLYVVSLDFWFIPDRLKTVSSEVIMSDKVYKIITDRIIEKMNEGSIPWQRPWGVAGAAKNLISQKDYRGINTFLLGSAGFESATWATFKQIEAKGGKVKKGSKSEIIVFWKRFEGKEQDSGEASEESGGYRGAMLRYYRVFNMDQVEGIEVDEEIEKIDFVEKPSAESVMAGFKSCPIIKHEENRAYFSPARDIINMPTPENFHSVDEYYSTLFHEAVHSTGHTRRLNREGFKEGQTVNFGSKSYSKEELIAEIGNAFLCNRAGIEGVFDNSVAYIQGWIKKFKDHPRMVIQSAAAAQKAVDFIQGIQPAAE